MNLSPVECRLFGLGQSPVISSARRRLFTSGDTPGDRLVPYFDIDGVRERFRCRKNEPFRLKTNRGERMSVLNADDDSDRRVYRAVLDNELLHSRIDHIKFVGRASSPSGSRESLCESFTSSPRKVTCPYTYSPLSPESIRLLRSPVKPTRKIHKVPYKILDAPELRDDFYLNLIDWSKKNVLSVGLGASLYLWNASDSQVTKLFDLGPDADSVTAVSWDQPGDVLAVGTDDGAIQLCDAIEQQMLSAWIDHAGRVSSLAWNDNLICSGSQDNSIHVRDVRVPHGTQPMVWRFHKKEICSLKWSTDMTYLASGSSDNRLAVWDLRKRKPIKVFTKHKGAVKALAWSPLSPSLLASGGGIRDRCIKIWNLTTGQEVRSVYTGSQVCNMLWSIHSSELVTTHGYNLNKTVIWQYPQMEPLAKLGGHTSRVLYLAMSPDGESIVTGGSDETLRFWRVFSKEPEKRSKEIRLS